MKTTRLYFPFHILFFLVFFNCQKKSENVNFNSDKIDFKYLNFEKFGGSSNLNLIFLEITNTSSDTLFLSKKNIIITVIKNDKTLLDNKTKSIGHIIYNPQPENRSKIDLENLQEKQTANLKSHFAQQVFEKNFKTGKSNLSKDYFIRIIENECLVVLPNSTINYGTIFNNEAFDATCEVKTTYNFNKVFTFTEDEKGNRINIYAL